MTRIKQHKAQKRRVKGHYIYDTLGTFFVPLTKHIFKMQRTNNWEKFRHKTANQRVIVEED